MITQFKQSFSNDNEYLNFLNTIKDKSIADFNVELSAEKGILTLSTCGNDNKKRYNSFKNTRGLIYEYNNYRNNYIRLTFYNNGI